MKKSIFVMSLLIGSMVLIGCGSGESSKGESSDKKSSTFVQSTGENALSSEESSENSSESLSKLHINSASDLYGYTIKASGSDKKMTIVYAISCSGNFTFRWFTNGTLLGMFNAEGNKIMMTKKSIDFLQTKSDGKTSKAGFLFKNDTQDLVVGQTNYGGLTEVLITSIVKNASCK